MDIKSLKKKSDLMHDIAVSKKNALEKMHSRQIVAYNGRLFRADAQTINVVQTFKSKTFYILEPDNFLQILIERNQESLNTYHQLFEELKKKRNV